MSTIIIHLETEAKEKAIKAVLEALDINFDQQEELYHPQTIAGLEKGILQAKNGQTKTYAEVKERLANRWS